MTILVVALWHCSKHEQKEYDKDQNPKNFTWAQKIVEVWPTFTISCKEQSSISQ